MEYIGKKKNTKKKNVKTIYRLEEKLLYVSVILSSFVGMSVFGVSLNKIALIPLEIYLLTHFTSAYVKKNKKILIWYFFSFISAVNGLFVSSEVPEANEKLILLIIQIVLIYIPIVLLSDNLTNPYDIVKKAIISMAQINAIWAIVQFILWYGMKIDLNDFVFHDIFNGVLGEDWSVWTRETGKISLRIAGLQSDGAFFSTLLCMGICFVEKKVWRYIFVISIVLSMSRTGIVVMFVILFFFEVEKLKKKKITKKDVVFGTSLFILISGLAVTIYFMIPSVNSQVNVLLYRMSTISFGKTDSGTFRHLMYLPVSIGVWFMDFSVIGKIIGVGPRIGGVALLSSEYAQSRLVIEAEKAWAIECDYADILLGRGILGLIIYAEIITLYKKKKEFKPIVIMILITGFMYNIIDITLIQLLIIMMEATTHKSNNSIIDVINSNTLSTM